MSLPRFTVWGVTGVPEIGAGDDLVSHILQAVAAQEVDDPEAALRDGDILVVTSKIVSKAEGRQFPAADREKVIAQDTVRVVAERVHPGGVTQIVETRHGLIMAAAGVDTSNVPDGIALRLPEDPDASARAMCAGLRERLGITLGVIITDTMGRPWRVGQTDVAIGAAGVMVTDDMRGGVDANGRPLQVTITVLADELAGATDLVKGKATGIPIAVVRGLGRLVTDVDAPGARTLVRSVDDDMFRFGSAEAYRLGYEAALAELRDGGQTTSKRVKQRQD
ncbi:coenzyme F420-0:L-glutamate ligase [Devosia sp. J2-20]|jgi:coenzyme F420-0:L-glutamate ligase/coenzyme F420-1:gamma-L-glutamate ligase|uniref:coenzyme F420-0:L-glutamate ligase n=1 Tax=Devosia TaxID=46913 RepID=UPI0022AE756A|nr:MULTISPECIES: coenzyme F420-0:L-glutamate ligase [Devosia]MCZ4345058.1 coenzyme F420-0:L-glutamate ligase [Devosia neptuniae]WDQ98494.1 coenzyme F420-0:L-glutamate ligase [Devosia sp. J2-20]|tara:strand:- start:16194 stop:17030 length:837 start_codon:yes stop_codon:yes gene_type:complete